MPYKYHVSQGGWDAVFPEKEVVSYVSHRSKMKEAKISAQFSFFRDVRST